ncbi:hypothetical protein GBAR_LOCUS4533 [Geodia barretti]|uniref:Uncharacterized protein n=1 Tax=Geodia barretti TaxID=519541 RepID=A0AA35R8H0_GEOBA|nr:hypothetical protein GBAR_LOCUS4533 [Geodia barretti]
MLNVDFGEFSPQFSLSCVSTGGPATRVTWTRDSTTVTQGTTESLLVNATTAEYIHTLNVTGRMEGRYTCTVANNKPSNGSACRDLPDQPIIVLMGKSPNSLNFTWNVSNTIDTKNYTFKWQKIGCLAENRTNNGSITSNDTSYVITGLEEGSRYNITVTTGGLSNTVYAVTTLKG